MAELHVELVSAEREIWSGEAREVLAKTLDGEIGILPQHAPVLGTLVDGGLVRVLDDDHAELVRAAVDGGFISVANDRVSILAETAELADEIDPSAARAAYDRARTSEDEDAEAEAERAKARLRAAGEEV
ncbi:MAG: F0F1 ATP synthase subunit epsilon [Streptosporangiales bacterium]